MGVLLTKAAAVPASSAPFMVLLMLVPPGFHVYGYVGLQSDRGRYAPATID